MASLNGIWTMQWTQKQPTRTLMDVTHGIIPYQYPVRITSYVHDLCTKSHFVQEKYALQLLDHSMQETQKLYWVMHGELGWDPLGPGYRVAYEYECGMLYVDNPYTLPVPLLGYHNAPLDMTYTLHLFDIVSMGAMSRVDRDIQQCLTMYHRKICDV